jgi:phosphomannomutase
VPFRLAYSSPLEQGILSKTFICMAYMMASISLVGGTGRGSACVRRSSPLRSRRTYFSTRPYRSTSCLAADSAEVEADYLLKTFQKLQNGSDIRGVALDDNPVDEPVTLTPARTFYIGKGFASWLKKEQIERSSDLKVSIGSDPRLSSDLLSSAMAAGLASEGIEVVQFGTCTTPAMFMSCILPKHSCSGGIMITASHLPRNRNGAKFFTAKGGLGKQDIKEILQLAYESALADKKLRSNSAWYEDHAIVTQAALEAHPGRIHKDDFLKDYAAYLRNIVIEEVDHPHHREYPLKGLKIVVNPGNGSGGFFATEILGPLGADVSDSIHLEPDGNFPAHQPNPEDQKAVEATVAKVLEAGADLGIMLDTDVDRSGFIDGVGNPINRNRYIALASAIALKSNPGATIVTDSCTSNGLKRFIEGLGGKHFRFKKGYKNIIDKGIELNEKGVDCPLMMETSGHGALRENYFLDDGAYGALKIVIEAVKRNLEGQSDIVELLRELREPKEAMEIRIKIVSDDVQAEGSRVTAAFKEWVDSGRAPKTWTMEGENYEGWRVSIDEGNGNNGWLLVRPSLHDPDIVINVESEEIGGMKRHLHDLLDFNWKDFQVSTRLVDDYCM